jgi:hypothetical protein
VEETHSTTEEEWVENAELVSPVELLILKSYPLCPAGLEDPAMVTEI